MPFDTTYTIYSKNLYSSYADKNFQEFWAESVEIFFEKPSELKLNYPQLYFVISSLLNQDTFINENLPIGYNPG